METLSKTIDAWRTLIELQDSGKVKMIGISNAYQTAVLESLGDLRKVQVLQNRWYEGNDWDREMFSYCRVRGIQYQSFWTLTGSPSLLRHPSILKLTQEASCTPAQAVYRIAQLRGIVPLAGSQNEAHMKEGVETAKIDFETSSCAQDVKEVNKFIDTLHVEE